MKVKSQKGRARVIRHCIDSIEKKTTKGNFNSYILKKRDYAKKKRKNPFFQFSNFRSGRSEWLLLRQWNVDQ